MHFDPQSVQILISIIIGLFTILSYFFGWFAKAWGWITSLFKPKPQVGVIDIPTQTMVLIPVPNALWWHMGKQKDQPAMQIVGDLNVTNISKYGLYVMGAKIKKPKAAGDAFVRAQNSNVYGKNLIPQNSISDLRFDFWIESPVCEKGEAFKADIAIVDQFGNEHWLKNLEFPYR